MKVKSIILTIILGFFYPFSFLPRIHKKRITFISLEHKDLSKDFKVLHDKLKRESDFDVRTCLFKFEPTILGNISYVMMCIKQLFIMQTSQLVIIDYNNFVFSKFKHRSGVKILEIWHATGAIKKFGNYVTRSYQIRNYDYVIANADFYKEKFAKAFDVSEDHVLVTGIPNSDKIFSEDFVQATKERLENRYPQLIGKKVITYAPTFRGTITTKIKEVEANLENISKEIGNEYILVYKAHPLVDNSKYSNLPNVLEMEGELISSIFTVTDILITDYSAIAIDWMVFDKPIISFVPDFKKYKKRPGFFIDYLNEFPGEIAYSEKELVAAILKSNVELNRHKRAAFREKMFKYTDGQSTQRVYDTINEIMIDTSTYIKD